MVLCDLIKSRRLCQRFLISFRIYFCALPIKMAPVLESHLWRFFLYGSLSIIPIDEIFKAVASEVADSKGQNRRTIVETMYEIGTSTNRVVEFLSLRASLNN